MLVLSISAFCIYFLLTALPVFFYDCPYKTPLTSVLSYITYVIAAYRPRRRRRGAELTLHQWHPEKQSTHLTNLWAQAGSLQGTTLDHTALRWTLLSFTDPSDLELFVSSLPELLQSDSGTSFTPDGVRTVQALLFGPDMLAKIIAGLLRSTLPSDTLALSPADRRRLDARAAMCLSAVSLLARACEGPTMSTSGLWSAWATMYSNPVARDTLAFRAYRDPALATLALSTALLLARRALIAYRTFVVNIYQRAASAATGPASLFPRFPPEIRARLSEGAYLARALGNVLHGLAGDPASGIGGGALLAQRARELLDGALHAASHAPGNGPAVALADVGVGVGGVVNWELGTLAQAARADMVKAKVCFAVLFMYATVMELLFAVRHAHGEEDLTVFDADRVVALYQTIHA
ncbi:hypothetical protein BC827DRAFT_967382 [Russula dissimulans]|nr:hypothetical protein BC827DRAFT_967382 [Russula dissimulans]